MWCSAGWSTTERTRLRRFIETSSTSMTWGLVGVGIRSTSWMRPGSPRRHLGICVLGGVFLVVFVRHLCLGDLSCLFLFLLLLLLGCLVGSPFSFVVICCVITVVCLGFWVLVVLVVSCWFSWCLENWGFPCFFCCYIWSLFCMYLF